MTVGMAVTVRVFFFMRMGMTMLAMRVLFFMRMGMTVTVRAPLVPSMRIVVEDSHDYYVADEAKNASYQHVLWLINDLFIDQPLCGLDKQFSSDKINDCDIDEGSKRFGFFPAKGEVRR